MTYIITICIAIEFPFSIPISNGGQGATMEQNIENPKNVYSTTGLPDDEFPQAAI